MQGGEFDMFLGDPEPELLSALGGLLSSGLLPDIDMPVERNGKTLLMLACRQGHAELARRLVSAGADINRSMQCSKCQIGACDVHDAPHTYLFAPLLLAAERGHLPVVQVLVEAGAATRSSQGPFDPLAAAAGEGRTAVVRCLLEAGADASAAAAHGGTPLGYAAVSGHLAVVDLLLRAGAEVDADSAGVGTALTCAAQEGHTKVGRLNIHNHWVG